MKIAVMVTNKNEEMEVIVPIDLWRRAGITVQTISVEKKKNLTLQNGIKISCDDTLTKENLSKYNAIYIPGGNGCENFLQEYCVKLTNHLTKISQNTKLHILAICAAPAVVLGKLGLTKNVNVTCFPGFEKDVEKYSDKDVVIDKNFITAKGPGVVIDFSLSVIEKLISTTKAKQIANQILYKHWK